MKLLKEIRACSLCSDVLPHHPRPILQLSTQSKILIIGQAPGIKAHLSGKPWNDLSGERLRSWLSLDERTFYDPKIVAIVPIGFCYPGKGKSGDLPPRPECSTRWLDSILCHLNKVELTILVGSYAAKYFFKDASLTPLIQSHSTSESPMIVLPHPSPRNNIWLAKNKWFETESLPRIKKKIQRISIPKA